MHRIPYGKAGPGNGARPVIYLQHGLEGAGSNWVTNLPFESAGFLFTDAGFDVWMGNFRGNTYGKRHVSLDVKSKKILGVQVFLDGRSKGDVAVLLSATTFNTPPLVIAARNGHLDVVKYLIEKGANITQTGTVSFDGETFVKYLVEHGADLELSNHYGDTPLMMAAYKNKVDVVRYLLSAGVDVNKKSFRGNTCLHDAAEAGSVAILQLLLDAGANIQRDQDDLTPMLIAASNGHCNVVEFFANQSGLCSRDEICDSLKLLGATCIDDRNDFVAAKEHWRRAVELCDDSNENLVSIPAVYGSYLEVRSQVQLDEFSGDPDALRMQALIIRERILGIRHPDTFYYLHNRGSTYALVGRYDRCFELWMHELTIQQTSHHPPIISFLGKFCFFLDDYLTIQYHVPDVGHDQAPIAPNFDEIFTVLSCAVKEIERSLDSDQSSIEDLTDCEECTPQDTNACMHRLSIICLYLLALIGCLDTKVTDCERKKLMILLYRLVHLHPVGHNEETLLHLACTDQPKNVNIGVYSTDITPRFPSLYVCRMLLYADANPNALDDKGQSPLHILLKGNVVRPSIVRSLLEYGAHIDLCSSDHSTPLSLMSVRPWSLHTGDILPMTYMSLKCLAASVIRKNDLQYENLVPSELVSFVNMH